jgi:hypothetical protein
MVTGTVLDLYFRETLHTEEMLISRWHATLSVCAAILQPAVRTIARQNARKSTAMTSMDRATVGVIGGGLAGVTACRTLAAAGVRSVLHERELHLGGRLGRVEVDGRSVGAGCSYIQATDPDFLRVLETWSEEGIVAEWLTATPHVISEPGVWAPLESTAERWFVGCPHMASPVTLSDPDRELIEVCTGDVFDVNYEASMWVVAAQPPSESSELMAEIEEQAVLDLDAPRWNPRSPTAHLHTELIIATPVHEASNFVQRKTLDAALGRARYKDFVKERVSAVFVFESSLRLPFGFASLTCGSPITVAICESSRREAAGQAPAGDDSEVWVVQSATGWASRALEDEMEPAAMRASLLEAFAAALGRKHLPALRAAETVVWPYGDRDFAIPGGCVWLDEMRLAMAGDWAFNGRLEGAWLSGRAAAQKVLAARENPRASG